MPNKISKPFALGIMLFLCCSNLAFAQTSATEKAAPIVAEGKLLYRSEMASWYGTDIFLEKYANQQNIGGYFSYIDGDTARCVFFSNSDKPVVIGTISFDSTYDTELARRDLTERQFTETERTLYTIRQIAFNEILKNTDGFLQFYEDTSPNIIPLVSKKEKKVYILTGPKKSGYVIIGNDYLFEFDKNNQISSKKKLHKNILSIPYLKEETDGDASITMHTHTEETGDFITATDICTLMLYEVFAKWKSHQVVSKNYVSIWDCKRNDLIVMTMEAMKRNYGDLEERKKKKN